MYRGPSKEVVTMTDIGISNGRVLFLGHPCSDFTTLRKAAVSGGSPICFSSIPGRDKDGNNRPPSAKPAQIGWLSKEQYFGNGAMATLNLALTTPQPPSTLQTPCEDAIFMLTPSSVNPQKLLG